MAEVIIAFLLSFIRDLEVILMTVVRKVVAEVESDLRTSSSTSPSGELGDSCDDISKQVRDPAERTLNEFIELTMEGLQLRIACGSVTIWLDQI